LAGLVERRTAQLIDYQNAALARRYLALVQRGVSLDSDGQDWRLTKALAEGWYKLLAYKDEYEVARLHAATDYTAIARELGIEGDFALSYHLHPPALEALGVKHKLAMGWTARTLFAGLRRMKGLRGTPFDPFAMLADRRLERDVVREYEQVFTEALGAWPYEALVELAASASLVRGYGHVKDRNVEAWRGEIARQRSAQAGSA
jgi:indolepyruvate ferredoxin oxidoreductase